MVLPRLLPGELYLLTAVSCSWYHRIKCYMVIAACVHDWEDADDLLTKSEVLWQMVRQLVTRRGVNATSYFVSTAR